MSVVVLLLTLGGIWDACEVAPTPPVWNVCEVVASAPEVVWSEPEAKAPAVECQDGNCAAPKQTAKKPTAQQRRVFRWRR
jgi:hypothetical protein